MWSVVWAGLANGKALLEDLCFECFSFPSNTRVYNSLEPNKLSIPLYGLQQHRHLHMKRWLLFFTWERNVNNNLLSIGSALTTCFDTKPTPQKKEFVQQLPLMRGLYLEEAQPVICQTWFICRYLVFTPFEFSVLAFFLCSFSCE